VSLRTATFIVACTRILNGATCAACIPERRRAARQNPLSATPAPAPAATPTVAALF
jgi:hypothetical protein